MTRMVLCIGMLLSAMWYVPVAASAQDESASTETAPVVAAAAVAEAPQEAKPVVRDAATLERIKKMKEQVAARRKELEGTVWDVAVTASGSKGSPAQDTFTFAEGMVSSKNLGPMGYTATNFTLKVEEDGTAVWETMQSSETDGVAFLIGTIRGDTMSGVMSKRDKKDVATDYSFVGKASAAQAPAAQPAVSGASEQASE